LSRCECGTEIAEKALICFRCAESVTEAVHVIFAVLILIAILIGPMR
jgi:hypothetical protein